MLLIHCERASSGKSPRSGLTWTNWQPRARGARHRATLDMLAGAAAGHHAVLQRHAAEGEHDIAVLGDLLPGDVALGQILVVADDVRHDDGGGAGTI